jgi:hypothetical protein
MVLAPSGPSVASAANTCPQDKPMARTQTGQVFEILASWRNKSEKSLNEIMTSLSYVFVNGPENSGGF